VDPSGNVRVDCDSSGGSTSGPGAFTVSAVSSITAPASGQTVNWTATVLRTGGTAGAATVDYTVAGTACASAGPTTLSFADGGTAASQSQTATVAITGAGTCTMTLSNPTVASLGTTSSVQVNATASSGGTGNNGVPIVAGCAAPDPTTSMGTLPPYQGVPSFPVKPSGVVTSYPLPALPAGKFRGSISLGASPKAFTPSNYSLDYSFSPCPGVLTPPAAFCGQTGFFQAMGGTFSWVNVATYSNIFQSCFVPAGTQYYFNVRWTFSVCSGSTSSCGFSLSTSTN
jgi:hypothetical protein